MDRELICLIICFIVGIFLFYLLKQSCGCNVVEAHRTDCVIPSEIQSEMDWENTCIEYIKCDNNKYKNTYKILNCDRYCKSFTIDSDVEPDDIPNIPDSEMDWENICIKYIKCDNNKHKNTYKILNCDRYCKRFTIDLEVDSDDIPYIPDSVVELTLNNVLDPSILSSILSSLNNLKSLQILSPRDLQARPQEPAALDFKSLPNPNNLQSLTINGNQIADITQLENLTNLQKLHLYDNNIDNITPLENLTNLHDLDLYNNNITDITPIENLTNLQILILSDNNITDITPLENLTNLLYLDLINNNITKISSLQGLTNLQDLYLSNNNITDITPLENLTNLLYLNLDNNPISNQNDLDGNKTIVSLISNNESLEVIP